MKNKALITALVLIALIVSIIYYFKSGGEIINEDIPANKLGAKEMVEIVKPYVDKYWNDRSYQVGKISMTLDKNLEGRIEIWFKDNKKDRNGVPNIITVDIDTKENKILKIIDQERDSKIVPGNLNISAWSIDSGDAIRLAKKAFDNEPDFIVVYVSGNDLFRDGMETWDVTLFNERTKKSYYVKIDVYTGEVYRKEVK